MDTLALPSIEIRRQLQETLAALVDFYERVEEKQRAMDVLQRLSKMEFKAAGGAGGPAAGTG